MPRLSPPARESRITHQSAALDFASSLLSEHGERVLGLSPLDLFVSDPASPEDRSDPGTHRPPMEQGSTQAIGVFIRNGVRSTEEAFPRGGRVMILRNVIV